eukprot:TRINITY_DN36732_c0_g1_i1.p1 TRINITY_DN36732_c0_g1~~TRINITY_DN36732_c0_g1_i1.p1  ORF type:complete len:231 (-),score=25.01 TRINITY_DN36732_c0_g1_i1:129-821(-)
MKVAYLQPSTSSISTSSTLALAPQMSATNIPAQLVSMTQVAASPPELQTHQCQQQQQARTMQIMQMQALATVYEQTSQQKLVNAVALEGQVEELKTEVTQKKDKLMQLESQIEEQHCSIAQQEADLITNKIQEINKLSHVAHKEHQVAPCSTCFYDLSCSLSTRIVDSLVPIAIAGSDYADHADVSVGYRLRINFPTEIGQRRGVGGTSGGAKNRSYVEKRQVDVVGIVN